MVLCPCVAFKAGWVVSWFTLIADGLCLDRYVLRTCYGVGIYYIFILCIFENKEKLHNFVTLLTSLEKYMLSIYLHTGFQSQF